MAGNPRTANGHRRREIRARVLAEESHCGVCGGLVDKSLSLLPDGSVDPLRAEVDEIVPVSRGGSPYVRSNCQLTHRICNARKRDRVLSPPAPVRAGPAWPLSGAWL